jgi:tryptophanyl-tRNA synthetase
VTVTKDDKIGVFVKVDTNVKELLDTAETILRNLQFTDLRRITEYKAIYITQATEKDIQMIDEALARLEPSFQGYGFLQPSSTYHRFITGLTGEKMSSSKPESAIFLTDTPAEAKKKIMNAKTGGAVTLEEQKKSGGKPDECMIYELFLYHLIEDDTELHGIYESCKKGKLMCGMCKKQAAELMGKFLVDLQEKRTKALGQIQQFIR